MAGKELQGVFSARHSRVLLSEQLAPARLYYKMKDVGKTRYANVGPWQALGSVVHPFSELENTAQRQGCKEPLQNSTVASVALVTFVCLLLGASSPAFARCVLLLPCLPIESVSLAPSDSCDVT